MTWRTLPSGDVLTPTSVRAVRFDPPPLGSEALWEYDPEACLWRSRVEQPVLGGELPPLPDPRRLR